MIRSDETRKSCFIALSDNTELLFLVAAIRMNRGNHEIEEEKQSKINYYLMRFFVSYYYNIHE